jgi:hypothetical protein
MSEGGGGGGWLQAKKRNVIDISGMEEGSQYANGFGIQSPYSTSNCKKKKREGQGREERQDNKILNPKKNRFQLGKKDETGVNMASN